MATWRRSDAVEWPPLTLVLAGILVGAPAAAQGSHPPWRWAEVTTCPAADSLLGAMRGDWAARVHGFYDPAGDSTMLWSGSVQHYDDAWWVSAGLIFRGRSPLDYPQPVFGIFVHEPRLRRLALDAATPPVIVVLDDSIVISLGKPRIGTYEGAIDLETVPLSTRMTALQFAGTVRARAIRVNVGDRVLTLSGDDRRNLRGFYRLTVCPQPVRFGGEVDQP